MTYTALLLASLLFAAVPARSAQRFEATGLVLRVDPEHQTLLVSHEAIPGYMEAMIMPWRVREHKELDNLRPGEMIRFTLVVTKTSSYLANIRERPYESMERDPDENRRLRMLDAAMQAGLGSPGTLGNGQPVPDFTLIDQNNNQVSLSQFRGKVVALTFIYTRCPLPDYCLRLTNNFGRLQKRFAARTGKDLVLLSISFDPDHDQPDVLAHYANVWKANAAGWHFLTGPLSSVKQVCGLFGMNFWPDEGLLTHSLHTVIIGRDGRLVANLEGNQFSAEQLGDLVETTMTSGLSEARARQ
jgi:protein SCO1